MVNSMMTALHECENIYTHICRSNLELRYVKLKAKLNAARIKVKLAHWLILVILATQEAEIRRITVSGQPRQIVHKCELSVS
jgi:hypothetical protein